MYILKRKVKNMKRLIEKNFEHWQLGKSIKSILLTTTSKEQTRYALRCISVEDNKFIATNGRKLVIVEKTHKITRGLYFLTLDGFLLPCPGEGDFPKYGDIILKSEDCKRAKVGDCATSEQLFSKIVYELNQAKVCFNLLMLRETLMPALEDVDECIIETVASDRQFQIRFDSRITTDNYIKILYIQMPLS